MGKPNPASRRAALEAQRQAALASRRRGRMIGGLVGALCGLLLAAGLAWWWNVRNQPESVAVGSQVAVPHASNQGRGITVAKTPTGKPTLVVYEDYQCPWCKVAHDGMGPQIDALVAKGEIGVEVRTLDMLDAGLNNDASLRAATAAACADVDGTHTKYRDTVFANQPQKEGTGYTDQQLRQDFAASAGVKDLTAFQTCYDQRQTHDAVQKVLDAARDADRDTSTPQYWAADEKGELKNQLDLKTLMGQRNPTEEELLAAIKAAA